MTSRNDYWLNAVWGELPYRIPGVEGLVLPVGDGGNDRPGNMGTPDATGPFRGHIRYNTDIERLEAYVNFQWETLVSGDVPITLVVDTVNNLPIAPQADGSLAVVLNSLDGGGHQSMFVWNDTNTDLGTPLHRWLPLASTELFADSVVYRNEIVFDTFSTNIGSAFALPFNPYIKEINVDIQETFDPLTKINIWESGGSDPLMDENLINAQLVGTYQLKITGSNVSPVLIPPDEYVKYLLGATGGTGQIEAIITGGPGGGPGRAVVYIKAVTQLEETPGP